MTSARRHVAVISGWLLLCLLSASSAFGGTIYDFESSNTGPIPFWNNGAAPGWDGWYTPPPYLVLGSVQASVYTYADLPQGVTRDPVSAGDGQKVLGLLQTPSGSAERAQHNFDFSQSAEWSVAYDLLVGGQSAGTNNIGSFSVLRTNPGGTSFIVVNAWESPTSSTWASFYYAYDAAGDELNPDGVSPGSAWTRLSQNHWYSESTVFDRNSNRILFVSITDLTTSSTTTVSPSGWYMGRDLDGPIGANAFRFAGFGPTNGLLVDNVSLNGVPEPATLFLTGLGLIALIAFRRR